MAGLRRTPHPRWEMSCQRRVSMGRIAHEVALGGLVGSLLLAIRRGQAVRQDGATTPYIDTAIKGSS